MVMVMTPGNTLGRRLQRPPRVITSRVTAAPMTHYVFPKWFLRGLFRADACTFSLGIRLW